MANKNETYLPQNTLQNNESGREGEIKASSNSYNSVCNVKKTIAKVETVNYNHDKGGMR